MRLKLKGALPWLVLALLLPLLSVSFTAGTVGAVCPCQNNPPLVTKAIRVDVSPRGAGDVALKGRILSSYPAACAVEMGESVYLEVWPAAGYYFVGWSGDLTGNEAPVYVKMTTDKLITAHFFPEEIVSGDNRLHLVFPVGTVVEDNDGELLDELEIAVDETPLPQPPAASLIGLPYELRPHGVSFDRPVSLSCSYDPSQIPPRVAEEELALAYYDEDSDQWLVLPSVVDVAGHIVSAPLEHLSTFAVIAPNPPPLPASFTPSALTISPLETDIGETVTISILVTNSGEAEGSYSVVLTINGAVVETRELTMAGGSQTVTFSTAEDAAGSYSVEINGLEGSFTVLESPPLPGESSGTSIWVILGPVLAALIVTVVIVRIIKIRRDYYYY